MASSALGVGGLRFDDEIETTRTEVAALRAQGIEAIVVVMHDGSSNSGACDACKRPVGAGIALVDALDPGVDLVIDGQRDRGPARVVLRIVSSYVLACRERLEFLAPTS